jgi:hypothetical protein
VQTVRSFVVVALPVRTTLTDIPRGAPKTPAIRPQLACPGGHYHQKYADVVAKTLIESMKNRYFVAMQNGT